MSHQEQRSPAQPPYMRDAVLTLLAVFLAFAAFDDITTDNATSFVVEWVALAFCAVWFAALVWRLLRVDRPFLAVASLVALATGTGAQLFIGSTIVTTRMRVYVATVAALAWFLLVAAILFGQARRSLAR